MKHAAIDLELSGIGDGHCGDRSGSQGTNGEGSDSSHTRTATATRLR